MPNDTSSRVAAAVRHMFGPLFAALLVGVLAATFLMRSDYHSPFDEYTHFDFVVKIASELRIPEMGEPMGQIALQEWACKGEQSFAALECGASWQDPALAPWGGISPALQYSVVSYAVTGLGTRLIHTVAQDLSWMDSARISSAAWLVALCALMVSVGRRLRGPTTAAMAAAVLVGSMPQVLIQGVTVSNDIPAAFAALLAVWVWLRLIESSTITRLGVSGLFAGIALLVKQHAIIALAVIAALEIAHRYRTQTQEGRSQALEGSTMSQRIGAAAARTWQVAGPSVIASAVVLVGFVLSNYLVEPSLRGPRVEVLGQAGIIAQSEPQDAGLAAAKAYGFILAVFQTPSWINGFNGPWAQLIALATAVAVVGGLVFALLRTSPTWRESPFGVFQQVTAAYVLLFPAAFLVMLRALGSPFFSQPRYYIIGMSFGVLAILVGSGRRWSVLALLISVMVWAFMMRELWPLPPA